MQRFNTFARVGRSSSLAARPGAGPRLMLVRTKIDKTSIGNDMDAAMDKNYADAKYTQGSNDKETLADRVRPSENCRACVGQPIDAGLMCL